MTSAHEPTASDQDPMGDSDSGPPLKVEFALPNEGSTAAETLDALAETVLAHQRALHVPGRLEIAVNDGTPGQWWMRVNGRVIRCPDIAVAEVVRDVTGGRTADLAAVAPHEVPALAAGLCTETLQIRLSVLLDSRHLPPILDRAGVRGHGAAADAAEAFPVVLDHGVPLDAAAVAGAFTASTGRPHPIDVAERLIDTGRATALGILFAPTTLRAVTSGGPIDLFPRLREALYNDRGILGPDFHLTADASMAEGTYAFRVNAVRTRSRRLPDGGGLPEVSVQLGRLLHRRASWFISVQLVRELCDRLGPVLPHTVGAVRSRYPMEWLTALARVAAEEGTSLRTLATILDRLLDIDLHPPDDLYLLREANHPPVSREIAELPRPRDAVVLLRQRMREETSRMTSPGVQRVHRLSPALEARLGRSVRVGSPGDDDAHEVVSEVRHMMFAEPGLPLIAPSLSLRSWLWEFLRPEFPELHVHSLTEYPPGLHLVTVPVAGAEDDGTG